MSQLIRMAHPNCESDRAESLARLFTLKDVPRASVPVTRELPATWDSSDWPEIASQTVGAVRDLSYLTWRYLKHPCFKYHFLAVPDGRRTGLAVWRLESIHRNISNGAEEVDKIGRLVEFLPVSRSNAGQLLLAFWNQLRAADALGADCFGYHDGHKAWLEEFGFHAVEMDSNGSIIPARFQPLEPRTGTILSVLRAQDSFSLGSEAFDGIWYWTKSDADQDRPN